MAIFSLEELRAAVPPDMRDLSDDALLRDYGQRIGKSFEETADYFGYKPRGTLREMGRQLVGGAVVDLPKMVGQSLEYTGLAPEYGREMAQAAEARGVDYVPDLRGRGLIGQAGVLGARAVAPMAPAVAASFLPGGQVAAPAVAAGLFGTSSAQETYDKLREQGVSEEDATAAARRVGLIQGPLEGAATAVGLRAAKGLAPIVGIGGKTTAGIAGELTDTAVLKPFAKGMATNMVVQPATEVAQDLGTYAVEQAYGAKAEDPYEIAKQSALGGAGLSMILGPLSLGSHVSRSRKAEVLQAALSEDAPAEVRAQAIKAVTTEARRQGVAEDDIGAWFNQQLAAELEFNNRVKQDALNRSVDLMGSEAQQLPFMHQPQAFSSLDQQRQFEQGMSGINLQTPFSSVGQQQQFEQDLMGLGERRVAEVGQQYQDLIGRQASGLMAAQDVGQEWQQQQAKKERGLAAATQAGEQWQEMRAERLKQQFGIEDIGREWQQLAAGLPQPVSTGLTKAQRQALLGPKGKRLKQTSSPFTAQEQQAPSASLLTPEPTYSSSLLPQAPAPVSQITERPASPPPGVSPSAVSPAAPVAAGASSTEDTQLQKLLDDVDSVDVKNVLPASVKSNAKAVPGRTSIGQDGLKRIRDALVKGEDVADEKSARIVDALRYFAEAYTAYSDQGGQALSRRFKIPKRATPSQFAEEQALEIERTAATVRQALAELGTAVGGNAKDVEAVVRLFKDAVQKKVVSPGRMKQKTREELVKLDTMLSQGWAAAKREVFLGEQTDTADIRTKAIRGSIEVKGKGKMPTLVKVATEGIYAGKDIGMLYGLPAILHYMRTNGTPMERALALALRESIVASGSKINLEFITEGNPRFDPKTNTVYLNKEESPEVILHEAFHAALQSFVYKNPNHPAVVQLKKSLKAVTGYKGQLTGKALEVQNLLKGLVAKGNELDAVLELISYGNTLAEFRKALQEMKSDKNVPKSFLESVNSAWTAIKNIASRLLGGKRSLANDVLESSLELLDKARSQTAVAGQGNVLEAAFQSIKGAITETAAFKKWFGDSKVVDDKGEPLVVFHGTVGDFTEFSKELLGSSTMAASAKKGFFFGGSADTAGVFARLANRWMSPTLTPDAAEANFQSYLNQGKAALAEAEKTNDPMKIAKARAELGAAESAFGTFINMRQNIMPVFLSMQNPLIVDQEGRSFRDESYAATIDRALKDGYDGVIIKNTYDGQKAPTLFERAVSKLRNKALPVDDIYIVFEPNQIKSVFNKGTFDPGTGNILEAAIKTEKPVSDAKIAAALEVPVQDYSKWSKANAAQLQATQRLFEAVGWSKENSQKMLGAAGDKTRAFISKNFPGAEIVLGWINSRYNVNETVSQVMDRFKLNKGIGYQYAEDLANVIARRPAADVKALFAYLDGNTKALDGLPDAVKLKAVADKLNDWFKMYVAELTPVEQQWFSNRKFSETLLFPSTTEQVAGGTFGLGKINEVLGIKTEREAELDQDWFRKDENGDLILTGDMYRVFEPNRIKNNGEMIPAGFMSASRFAELNSKNPLGFTVDTSRRWTYGGVVKGKHTFTTNTTAKEKIDNEKADDVANALRNTVAALANNYASKNFIKSIYDMGRGNSAHAQVAFDSLEAVNKFINEGVPADQRVVIREDMVLPVSREISRSPQTKALYRQSGTWVKLPESGVYGELSGKYIPGPVWNAMGDMSDRQPLVNLRAVNNTMRWFKKSKTVWNFGTHVTNTASNVTMAMMHDISFGTMRDAAKMLAKYEVNAKALTKEELDLVMAFRDSGAMLADYSSAEVKEAIYKAHEQNLRGGEDVSLMRRVGGWLGVEKSKAEWLQAQAKKVGKGVEYIDEVSTQMYAAEDNIFRMAAFLKTAGALQQRAGAKTPSAEMLQEAGLFARKAFGDYDIDSKAVKIARQTALPFISWFYAMAPVIGRIAVYEPWKLVNVLGAYMILEAAMAGAAGGDDEETRKEGPESIRERMFGSMGPYLHVRVPFMGDEENPVYYKLGDYFPLASFTRGLPNGMMGQSWIPASLTPSGPFVSALLGLVGGVDPYTGKALHKPTDTEWQKLWTSTKFAYDIMTLPVISTRNIGKVDDIIEGKTGITGNEPSSLPIARAFGFKFYDYNVNEQAAINEIVVKRIERDFKTAMTQAKRDEYRKAYPDYDALDEKLDDLQTRMDKEIEKARGGAEE